MASSIPPSYKMDPEPEKKVKNKRKKRVKKKKKASGNHAATTHTASTNHPCTKHERANQSLLNHTRAKSSPKESNEPQHEPPLKKRKLTTEEGGDDNRPRYSFQVDDTDHCETPIQAYKDLLPVLDRIAKSLNKKRSNLVVYDPYYCDGGVEKKLNSYGFSTVINRNRDFYQDIKNKETPEYDVLVTNPPYSGAHMEKLLDYCNAIATTRSSGKPFLLLLPHFVYTKDYYARALSPKVSKGMSFLVPEIRYGYFPPAWVDAKSGSKAIERGRTKTAPFPSFWYLHSPPEVLSRKWLAGTFGTSGSVRPTHRTKLRYANCTQHIPRDFRGEFDPNKKRANPKARKRAAKRRYEAMKAVGSSASVR